MVIYSMRVLFVHFLQPQLQLSYDDPFLKIFKKRYFFRVLVFYLQKKEISKKLQ